MLICERDFLGLDMCEANRIILLKQSSLGFLCALWAVDCVLKESSVILYTTVFLALVRTKKRYLKQLWK